MPTKRFDVDKILYLIARLTRVWPMRSWMRDLVEVRNVSD